MIPGHLALAEARHCKQDGCPVTIRVRPGSTNPHTFWCYPHCPECLRREAPWHPSAHRKADAP